MVDAHGPKDTLYFALNGVNISTDAGTPWRRYDAGLPNGSAKALDINTDLGMLVSGINGRGAWRIRIDKPNR